MDYDLEKENDQVGGEPGESTVMKAKGRESMHDVGVIRQCKWLQKGLEDED